MGGIVACFGVAQAIATAVPIAPCDKRIPMGFNGHIECPLTRKAAARQPWTMEYFPFREWLWRMADFALLEMLGDRMRMRFRSRRMDCPLGRFLFDACPVERTQRSAPPRHPWAGPFQRVVWRARIGDFHAGRFGGPGGRCLSDSGPVERTRRSALLSPVCWAHSEGCVEGYGLRFSIRVSWEHGGSGLTSIPIP